MRTCICGCIHTYLQGVFGAHDRSKVEVFCFSLLRDEGSSVQRRIQNSCEHYYDYTDLTNYEVKRIVDTSVCERISFVISLPVFVLYTIL